MYRILFTIIAILLILIIYKHKVLLLFSNSVNRCKQIHEPFDSTDFKQQMNSHDHYFEKQISNKKDKRRIIVNTVDTFMDDKDNGFDSLSKADISTDLDTKFTTLKNDLGLTNNPFTNSNLITEIESDTPNKKKVRGLLIKNLMEKLYALDYTKYNKKLPCVYYDEHNCQTDDTGATDTCILDSKNEVECNIKSVQGCNISPKCMYDKSATKCISYNMCIPKNRITDNVDECYLYSKYGEAFCKQLKYEFSKGISKQCSYLTNICQKAEDSSAEDSSNIFVDEINTNKCMDITSESSCKSDDNNCSWNVTTRKCEPKFRTGELNCKIYDSVYTNDGFARYKDKKELCINNPQCNFIEYDIIPEFNHINSKHFGKCVNDTELKKLIGTDTNNKNPELIKEFNPGTELNIETVKRINKARNMCKNLGDHYEWINNPDISIGGEFRCIPKCEILNKENCQRDPKNCYYDKIDDVCKPKCVKNETRDSCIKSGDCYWEDSGNTGFCHSLTKENNEEICGDIKASGTSAATVTAADNCNNNLHCYYDTTNTQCKAKDTDLEIMGGLLTDKEELKSII